MVYVSVAVNNAPAAAATLIDLDAVAGYSIRPGSLNNRGILAGVSERDSGTNVVLFNLSDASLTLIGVPPGAQPISISINNPGTVVGSFLQNGKRIALSGGQGVELHPIGADGTSIFGLNELGVMVGAADAIGGTQALILSDAVTSTLPGLGGTDGAALAINSSGVIVGKATLADGAKNHAVRWVDGIAADLNVFASSEWELFEAGAINESGVVLGNARGPTAEQPFFLIGTNLQLLAMMDGGVHARASALNGSNRVAGSVTLSDGSARAVLWQGDEAIDLNTKLDPASGWILREAIAINDAGVIAGMGEFEGAKRGFILVSSNLPAPSISIIAPRSGSELSPGRGSTMAINLEDRFRQVYSTELLVDGVRLGIWPAAARTLPWTPQKGGFQSLVINGLARSGELLCRDTVTVGVSQIPTDGLQLWLGGDGIRADAGAGIAEWVDLSGNHHSAVQASIPGQPLAVFDSALGQKVARFKGNEILSTTEGLPLEAGGEVFVVARSEKGGCVLGFGWQQSGPVLWDELQFNTLLTDVGKEHRFKTGYSKRWSIYHVTATEGVWEDWFNGLSLTHIASNHIPGSVPFVWIGKANNQAHFSGDIGEVIVYNRALSSPERLVVYGYLNAQGRMVQRPGPVTRVSAVAIGSSEILVSWIPPESVSGLPGEFRIERLTSEGQWSAIGTVTNAVYFTDRGLLSKTSYYYRVVPFNITGDASPCSMVSATTFPEMWDRVPVSPTIWLAGETTGGLTTGVWPDLSGTGRHGYQAATNRTPTAAIAAPNDIPSALFDGQDDRIGIPGFLTNGASMEVFAIVKSEPGGSLWHLGLGFHNLHLVGFPLAENVGRPDTIYPVDVDLGGYHLYHILAKNGEWTAWINGQLIFSDTNPTTTYPALLILGDNGPGTLSFQGRIADFCAFDRELEPPERKAVEQFFLQRSGIDLKPPTPPEDTLAEQAGDHAVEIRWKPSESSRSMIFEIQRRLDNGEFAIITFATNQLVWRDVNVVVGQSYDYRVRAINSAGPSEYGSVARATVGTLDSIIQSADSTVWFSSQQSDSIRLGAWLDQSGRRNHAAFKPTDGSFPVMGGENDSRAVTFLGTNLMKVELREALGVGEVFVVLESDSVQNEWRMGSRGISTLSMQPTFGAPIQESFGIERPIYATPIITDITQRHIYHVSCAGNGYGIWLNGLSQFFTPTNRVWGETHLTLGNGSLGNPFPFRGGVLEVLVFSRTFTEAERLAMTRHLVEKHRIVVELPSPENVMSIATKTNEVQLFWLPWIVSGKVRAIVERSVADLPFVELATVVDEGRYIDASVEPGFQYRYRVRFAADFGTGNSSEESLIAAPPSADYLPPSTPKLWLVGESAASLRGASRKWYDVSGNERHAALEYQYSEPRWNTFAGRRPPAPGFNSSGIIIPDLGLGSLQAEAWMVLRGPSGPGFVWKFGSSRVGSYYGAISGVLEDFGSSAGWAALPPNPAFNEWGIYGVYSSAVESGILFNGSRVAQGPGLFQGILGRRALGGLMDLAEVLIYDRTLDALERMRLQQYLNARHYLFKWPEAPPSIAALPVGTNHVRIRWSPVESLTKIGYRLERQIGSGSWTFVGGYDGALSVEDSVSPMPGEFVRYRVAATNWVGSSGYSPLAEVALPNPSELKAIGNPRMWLRAEVGGSLEPEFWFDRSGNGLHARQVEPGRRPAFVNSNLLGQSFYSFDGYDDRFKLAPDVTNAVQAEVWAVLRSAQPGGLWNLGGGTTLYPDEQGQILESFGRSTAGAPISPPITLGSFHWHHVVAGPTGYHSWINGFELESLNSNRIVWPSNPELGVSKLPIIPWSPQESHFRGEIAEVLFFDRLLTPVEQNAVASYLNQRYAIVAPISAPTNVLLQATATNQIYVFWEEVATNTSCIYRIERKTPGTPWQLAGFVTNGSLFVDSSIGTYTNHNYRIRCDNRLGTSPYSTVVSCKPLAAFPAGPPGDPILWLSGENSRALPYGVWLDMSGHGNHATQVNRGIRPLSVTNAIHGRRVAHFSGNGDFLNLPPVLSGATAAESWIVYQPVVSTGLWQMGQEGQSFLPWAGDGLFYEDFASAWRRDGIPTLAGTTNVRVLHAASLPQKWGLWENGVLLREEESNEFAAAPNPKLGWNGSRNVLSGEPENFFEGSVAEMLVFDHALSEIQRIEVDRYLNGRYGIQNHPPGPTNLWAYSFDPGAVHLAWNSPGSQVGGVFSVERKVGTNTWLGLAMVTNSNLLEDRTVSVGLSFSYRVRRVASTGVSAYSPVARIKPSVRFKTPPGGPRVWLSADYGGESLADSGIWPDNSGNATHGRQPAGDQRPTLEIDGTSGIRWIHFDGTNDSVEIPVDLNYGPGAEAFVVRRVRRGGGFWLVSGGGFQESLINPDGFIYENFGSYTRFDSLASTELISQPHVYRASSSPEWWSCGVNGTDLLNVPNEGGMTFPFTITLGKTLDWFIQSPFDGDIAECVIYDRTLGVVERDGVLSYLAQKYGIPLHRYADPGSADPDLDGLSNAEEIAAGSNLQDPDTDKDGLSDGDEIHRFGSSPLLTDTDNDGIPDGDEVRLYGTNPALADSEGDGLPDGWKLKYGFIRTNTAPLAATRRHARQAVESVNVGTAHGDPDEDGLDNLGEYQAGTNPLVPDTDKDGSLDGREVAIGMDPLNPDSDQDGVSDGDDYIIWAEIVGCNLNDLGIMRPPDSMRGPDGKLYTKWTFSSYGGSPYPETREANVTGFGVGTITDEFNLLTGSVSRSETGWYHPVRNNFGSGHLITYASGSSGSRSYWAGRFNPIEINPETAQFIQLSLIFDFAWSVDFQNEDSDSDFLNRGRSRCSASFSNRFKAYPDDVILGSQYVSADGRVGEFSASQYRIEFGSPKVDAEFVWSEKFVPTSVGGVDRPPIYTKRSWRGSGTHTDIYSVDPGSTSGLGNGEVSLILGSVTVNSRDRMVWGQLIDNKEYWQDKSLRFVNPVTGEDLGTYGDLFGSHPGVKIYDSITNVLSSEEIEAATDGTIPETFLNQKIIFIKSGQDPSLQYYAIFDGYGEIEAQVVDSSGKVVETKKKKLVEDGDFASLIDTVDETIQTPASEWTTVSGHSLPGEGIGISRINASPLKKGDPRRGTARRLMEPGPRSLTERALTTKAMIPWVQKGIQIPVSLGKGLVFGVRDGFKGDIDGVVGISHLLRNPLHVAGEIKGAFESFTKMTWAMVAETGTNLFHGMMSAAEAAVPFGYDPNDSIANGALRAYIGGYMVGMMAEQLAVTAGTAGLAKIGVAGRAGKYLALIIEKARGGPLQLLIESSTQLFRNGFTRVAARFCKTEAEMRGLQALMRMTDLACPNAAFAVVNHRGAALASTTGCAQIIEIVAAYIRKNGRSKVSIKNLVEDMAAAEELGGFGTLGKAKWFLQRQAELILHLGEDASEEAVAGFQKLFHLFIVKEGNIDDFANWAVRFKGDKTAVIESLEAYYEAVERAGDKLPKHHICTNKNRKSKAPNGAGPFSDKFDDLFLGTGINPYADEWIIQVPGHWGPHPDYNKLVYDRLKSTEDDLATLLAGQGSTVRRTSAEFKALLAPTLVKELTKIKTDLTNPLSALFKSVTGTR